jgi:hypothetical protein
VDYAKKHTASELAALQARNDALATAARQAAFALKVWKGISDEIDAGYPTCVDAALSALAAAGIKTEGET